MGVIGGFIRGSGAVASLGRAAQGLSEVFLPNATEGQALAHAAQRAALEQLGAEFALPKRGRFDRMLDGLNRLPRPLLALGTLALFVYAMAEPVGFAARMEGLGYVPDPLWWLLGAIVGFYFGARELHYARGPRPPAEPPRPEPVHSAWRAADHAEARPTEGNEENAALAEWRQQARM
ncbi:holin family protein [Jannaschia seohaensis]|uniref:Holin (3TMs family) n=1 Tax=Jannaschia seohaensis TaxID=475081 RepID=A0A2Y9ANS6_9RHOB|nr:holin family protein [Jannaschia seohaensis]PWJ19134.1 holin (3TMs family) [Jannaschia seohaensis]SSA45785.1 Holin of 3TMs, for gene-transfer release [Jannaschia seohaensis]